MRRTAASVTQCASRTRKRRAPVSRRRFGGGAKSAKKQSKDAKAKTVIKQMLKCSKDVTKKLQKYHDDPAGEAQFTKLMTEVLMMAGDTDSKLVKSTLNKLLPRGKYKIQTLSRTEIEKVSRKMHADRGFMKRNTLSAASWILVIIGGIICGVALTGISGLMLLLSGVIKTPEISYSSNGSQKTTKSSSPKTQELAAISIIFSIWTALIMKGMHVEQKVLAQNVRKLEQIVKQC
jgi:hypothetical protein